MGLVKIDGQFFIMIINLLVLYFILKKILFKPVTDFMENRTKNIQKQIDDANNKIKEADDLKIKHDEELKLLKKKSKGMLEESKTLASQEYDRIIMSAKEEVDAMRKEAERSIEAERQKVLANSKNEIVLLALSIASKILQKNIDNESNKVLLTRFVEEEVAYNDISRK